MHHIMDASCSSWRIVIHMASRGTQPSKRRSAQVGKTNGDIDRQVSSGLQNAWFTIILWPVLLSHVDLIRFKSGYHLPFSHQRRKQAHAGMMSRARAKWKARQRSCNFRRSAEAISDASPCKSADVAIFVAEVPVSSL